MITSSRTLPSRSTLSTTHSTWTTRATIPSTISRPRSSHIISSKLTTPTIATIPTSQTSALNPTSSSSKNGFTPIAIAGILAAMISLLILVCAIGIIMRRAKRKKCQEMLDEGTLRKLSSRDGSLRTIVVTKEVESVIVPVRLEDMDDKHVRYEVRGGVK